MEIKKGNFTLHSDASNVWITETITNEETGKTRDINFGYFRHVKDCLKAFASKKTIGSDAADIAVALEELDKAFDVVQDFIESDGKLNKNGRTK